MNTKTSVATERHSETDFFSFLTHYAFENNLSVALWRLPNEKIKNIITCAQVQYLKKDHPIEDLPPGFMFAPFDKNQDSIFLPADYAFSVENEILKAPQTNIEITSHAWLAEQLKDGVKPVKAKTQVSGLEQPDSEQLQFEELVKRCLSEIEKGSFEKIVPSRVKNVSLPDDFDIVEAFQKLCRAYPNALISLVSLPGIGTWLGATPELLVAVEAKSIFKTIALAGTKPFNENINLKNVAWTQKEIEEQALVERYIISCFKRIRLREYDEYGPRTVVAGNLMHLKSEFTVDMKATHFPQLGSTMLQLLHPTSAVCGMPLEPSLHFLQSNEAHERQFYAGYLGPVNFQNSINLFVNLRCMQLLQNRGLFYAGAGITIDSTPTEEWMETELKLNTLLNILLPASTP